ncbi:MAG TPA: hypothetical protein VKU62_10230, partial [Thermoanaerobaculia bacterium]|nr:hypothetical protein [Thermoanaerobaculia bacterium]
FTAASTLPRRMSIFASGFRSPYGVALSPAGELYVSDTSDNVVKRIASDTITTIAGALGQAGKADGQFALFNAPHGLAVTPLDGYIFAADTLNNEVRILYTGAPYVTAFSAAGTGVAGLTDDFSDKARFNAPMGVAATVRGNLYVADTGNNSIRKMTQVTGFIGYYAVSTVASGLHAPLGVAVDPNENVFVADTDAGNVLRNGSVIASNLDHPAAIAIDTRGNLFVTDRTGVHRIAPSGLMTTVVSGFDSLAGIAVDLANNIYVADSAAGVIRVLRPSSEIPARRRAVH